MSGQYGPPCSRDNSRLKSIYEHKPLSRAIHKTLARVRNKRARVVIDRIIDKGFITTEELKNDYGYDHPPRAARDVREAGIPLETFWVRSSEGRRIAAYRFGDLELINQNKLHGRIVFPKEFKRTLYDIFNSYCAICMTHYEVRYLQVDHKVPYEVAGDIGTLELREDDYMLLCGSCNRAKSWSCEHCFNWMDDKDPSICNKCYWANPIEYLHIALNEERRLDLSWEGDQIRVFEKLKEAATENELPLPIYVKKMSLSHKPKALFSGPTRGIERLLKQPPRPTFRASEPFLRVVPRPMDIYATGSRSLKKTEMLGSQGWVPPHWHCQFRPVVSRSV